MQLDFHNEAFAQPVQRCTRQDFLSAAPVEQKPLSFQEGEMKKLNPATLKAARELDKRALLWLSTGDKPLTDDELLPVCEAIEAGAQVSMWQTIAVEASSAQGELEEKCEELITENNNLNLIIDTHRYKDETAKHLETLAAEAGKARAAIEFLKYISAKADLSAVPLLDGLSFYEYSLSELIAEEPAFSVNEQPHIESKAIQ